MKDAWRRDLSYYIEDAIGGKWRLQAAQKRRTGGGRNPEDIGWAIGLEHLLLALDTLSG